MTRSKVEKTLREMTERIVHVANPARVLLFGSAATGKMTRNSDLDVLVVVRGTIHRRQMAQKIYRNLHGLGISIDVVVATESDVKKFGNRNGSILKPALQQGRVLYEA
ncbi:MAG: nucleotidyltransferase domain-containing protein [Chloroflexi bacterium]|nr:nucleotidyltransferase domain-containing protein [Chloroflexota bacterium]